MKIRLNLDSLTVESFVTASERNGLDTVRGTVEGNEWEYTSEPCVKNATYSIKNPTNCDQTCGQATCGGECGY